MMESQAGEGDRGDIDKTQILTDLNTVLSSICLM